MLKTFFIMDMQNIQHRAKSMKSREDLLGLINMLKSEDLQEKCTPYTLKQLGYFCNPNHIFHRYRNFTIPKKSGEPRQITTPYSDSYMYLLAYVNKIIQSLHTPSEHTMGFVPGRCVVDNAATHIGMNYVFNIDLKDFFPSIERRRICARLQAKPFCLSQEVALAIAGLCCMRVENGFDTDGNKQYKYVLPQGSPASPTLTNIVCDRLDYLLGGLAKRYGLRYTRYADDITFSSMHNVYQEGSHFRQELQRIITEQGFALNEKKTRLNKVGARQEVTGLTVSREKVNVTSAYVRDIRNVLYIWSKYGYGVAENKLRSFNAANRPGKRIGVNLANVLSGKLMFLKMVKGEDDPTFQKLNAQYNKLTEGLRRSQPKSNSKDKIVYLETMPIPEFEKLWGVKLEMKCGKDNGRYVAFSNKSEMGYSCASVLKKTSTEKPIEQLYISLCRDRRNKQFLMVHEKFVSPVIKQRVDIDKLSKDLDDVLGLNSIHQDSID